MIILQPIKSEQTISVAPRYTDYFSVEDYESRVLSNGGTVEDLTCVSSSTHQFHNVSISLRRDGDGKSETITRYFNYEYYEDRVIEDEGTAEALDCLKENGYELKNSYVKVLINGNFIDFTFSSDILEEGSTYYLEITDNGNLTYRDKIYVTGQNNYTIKHEVSKSRYIQPTGETNDNTYII